MLDLVAVSLRPAVLHDPRDRFPILVFEQSLDHQMFGIDLREFNGSDERTVDALRILLPKLPPVIIRSAINPALTARQFIGRAGGN